MNLPDLTKGKVGVVDFAVLNDVFSIVDQIRTMLPQLKILVSELKIRHTASFPAAITGFQEITANRWRYSWVEQQFNRATQKWENHPQGRTSSTFTLPAYNSIENANDGTGIEAPGVDINGADYPAGFDLQPIQGNPIVLMNVWTATDGAVYYWFTCPNDHDGTCSAAAAAARRSATGGRGATAAFQSQSGGGFPVPPGGGDVI